MEQRSDSSLATSATSARVTASAPTTAASRIATLPQAHLQNETGSQVDATQDSPANYLAALLVDCRRLQQNNSQHLNLNHLHHNHLNLSSHNQQHQQHLISQQLSNTRQHQVNQQHLLAQQLFSTIILNSSTCWPAARAAAAAAAFAAAAAASAPLTNTTTTTTSTTATTTHLEPIHQCSSPPVLATSSIEPTLNSVYCVEEELPSDEQSLADAPPTGDTSSDDADGECSMQSEQLAQKNELLTEVVGHPHNPIEKKEEEELIVGSTAQVVGQSANKLPARSSSSAAGSHKCAKTRRLYKCRHCGFETDKKVENWQHIRIHMRPEKLLACGSCQFVTEYKHHLEYHQRNHSGYKPFKCDNCDYQCVNKSMLNSHMKSHSSIYLYQCGDCRYATKYVHSLKMHLRKYNHQPAQLMIDVYGRKRGPKSSSASLLGSPVSSPKQSNAAKPINDATNNNSIQPEHTSGNILDLRVESKLAR